MSDFHVTVELPAKLYVKKYLEVRFGTPAIIHADNAIGKYFYQLCDEANQEQSSRINLKGYKDHVVIKLTKRIFFRKGYVLTPPNIVAFNTFVEDMIKENLEYFVMGASGMGKVKKVDAYNGFMEASQLNYDVFPLETLKKHLQRSKFFKDTRLNS